MKDLILVIGSANIDYVMKMKNLPKPGETLTDCSFFQAFGGKGANQAIAAARACKKKDQVIFISSTGNDPVSNLMLKEWKRSGLNIKYVLKNKEISTGAALIMVEESGENFISVSPGANYSLLPEHLERLKPVIKKTKIALFQNELLPDTTFYGLKLCHEENIITIFNFAPAREFNRNFLHFVDILIVNETEAEFLCGFSVSDENDAKKVFQNLSSYGVKNIIITLGAKGSIIIEKDSIPKKVQAFSVNAVDTTAAGDTFCGALAERLAEGFSLKESVIFASASAAISTTRLGAQPSIPFREEILSFLNAKNLTFKQK